MILIDSLNPLSDSEFIALCNLYESKLISEDDFLNEAVIIDKIKEIIKKLKDTTVNTYKDINYVNNIQDVKDLEDLKRKEFKRTIATSLPTIVLGMFFAFKIPDVKSAKNILMLCLKLLTPTCALVNTLVSKKIIPDNELRNLREKLQTMKNRNENIITDMKNSNENDTEKINLAKNNIKHINKLLNDIKIK